MTKKERELLTLSFSNEGLDRGAKEETMEPWDISLAGVVSALGYTLKRVGNCFTERGEYFTLFKPIFEKV